MFLQEVLDQDMPDLPVYEAPQEESDISIELQFPSLGEVRESPLVAILSNDVMMFQSEEVDPNALWEDEDTRQFYEGITDIKPLVPVVSMYVCVIVMAL